MLNKFLDENKAQLYAIFRIVIGLLFAIHGAMKFGLIGGTFGLPEDPLMLIAGIVELFGGIAILLGTYVQVSSVLGAIVMIGALVMVHFPKGLMPVGGSGNGGEAALLFLVAFFVLATHGPGIWSLDKKKK